MRQRAFTLVEIMIVVMIIGILLSIAVPGWMNARENSRQKTCLSNLRTINDAKEIWATDARKANGDPCTQADLWPSYLSGSSFPQCPSNGTYTLDVVGALPSCTVNTGRWPH